MSKKNNIVRDVLNARNDIQNKLIEKRTGESNLLGAIRGEYNQFGKNPDEEMKIRNLVDSYYKTEDEGEKRIILDQLPVSIRNDIQKSSIISQPLKKELEELKEAQQNINESQQYLTDEFDYINNRKQRLDDYNADPVKFFTVFSRQITDQIDELEQKINDQKTFIADYINQYGKPPPTSVAKKSILPKATEIRKNIILPLSEFKQFVDDYVSTNPSDPLKIKDEYQALIGLAVPKLDEYTDPQINRNANLIKTMQKYRTQVGYGLKKNKKKKKDQECKTEKKSDKSDKVYINHKEIKKRIELLISSIHAGNTSKKIKKEIEDLINYLLLNKKISVKQAEKYLKSF